MIYGRVGMMGDFREWVHCWNVDSVESGIDGLV